MKWVKYDDVMELLQAAREEGPCDVREIIWGLSDLDFITTDEKNPPKRIKGEKVNGDKENYLIDDEDEWSEDQRADYRGRGGF